MLAARAGNAEAVKALLNHDATVNVKATAKGQTALMWAAAEKHTDVVRLLIQFGADVNARSNGRYSALLFSARANDIETAKALLAAGANVNDADSDGIPRWWSPPLWGIRPLRSSFWRMARM